MALSVEQKEIVRLVLDSVVDAVKAAGPTGAPGGVIYAALAAQGCRFAQYESLMAGLVRNNRLRRDGDLYFIVEG